MWLASAGVTGVDPSAGPRFSQGGLAAQAAAEGRGVALLSTFLVADDLAAGRLVRPFAHALAEDFSYFFVCLPEGVDMPRIRAFRDWLLRELGVCADEPA
jgi:LysR family glycine cleavage system transcriptional activator